VDGRSTVPACKEASPGSEPRISSRVCASTTGGKQVWLLQAWRRLRTAGLAGVPARP
jgi:hypothetical protein